MDHGVTETLKKLSENNFLDDFYYLMTMEKTSYMLEIGKKTWGMINTYHKGNYYNTG
jgi:hypothetical protein